MTTSKWIRGKGEGGYKKGMDVRKAIKRRRELELYLPIETSYVQFFARGLLVVK